MVDCTAEELTEKDITNVDFDVKKILLPIDGSKYSIKAAKYAIGLAKLIDAKITAVFVDTGARDMQLPEENLEVDTLLGVRQSGTGLEVAKKLGEKNNVEVTTKVLKGGVTKQIVKYAQNNNFDLIVLGESGRTGLARLALGSVALSVTKAADVPVYVVK